MRIRTRSHQPASLSEAFARSSAKDKPSYNEIVSFFAWSLTRAWNNAKARKEGKPDDLIHYWTAIPEYEFDQKKLMNILKGLCALYTSDKISEEVKEYFRTEAAFSEWFYQYHKQPHTLHRPFMLECLKEFDLMKIEPAQIFLQDLQKTPLSASKPARSESDATFAP